MEKPPVDSSFKQERPNIPNRVLLFKVNEVEACASLVSRKVQPWHLPVDGLAIPMGVEAGSYGKMAQAIKGMLGEDLWGRLIEAIEKQSGGRVEPLKPVAVALDDEVRVALLPNAPRGPDDKPGRYHAIAATVGGLTDTREARQVAGAVVETAAQAGVRRLALPMLGTGAGAFKTKGVQVAEAMVRGVHDALTRLEPGAMAEVTLTTLDKPTFEAIQESANLLKNTLPQRLVSDQPAEQDLLNIGDEVGALAEALLLEKVEPPLAVGILGGWGSGKTTVMNLMRRRMTEIRGLASPGWPADLDKRPDTPYVGHVYLIRFNAWTYAKSSLWASLMHTIFFELSRQLTLEARLADTLAQIRLEEQRATGPRERSAAPISKEELRKRVLLEEDHRLWPVLYAAEEEAQSRLLETGIGREVVQRWRKGELTADALWTYLRERTEAETAALEKDRGDLAKAKSELEKELAQARKEQAVRLAWAPVKSSLKAVLSDWGWQKLEARLAAEDADQLRELERVAPGLWDAGKNALRHWPETVALLAFAAVAFVLPLVLEQAAWEVPSWIVAAATVAAGWLRALGRVRKELDGVRARYRAGVEAEQARIEAGERPLPEPAEVRKARQKVADLETRVQWREQRVGMTSRHRSVLEFVQARLEEGSYESQLGLMHCVECDLQELTDALYIHREDRDEVVRQKQALFPRGQPRVVLFIDDLDRCPPEKVVEVLESVQLLLKTKLFIVVMGIDTRYVTRALEKVYTGILRPGGDPSGLDYVEKILTLSYRVKPVRGDAAAVFLGGLGLEVAAEPTQRGGEPVRAPTARARLGLELAAEKGPEEPVGIIGQMALKPAVITFAPEEYEAIERVCRSIQLTPRALKRIGNVMKLVRIFWHRTDTLHNPKVVQTVTALLALSARYPQVMRDAFVEIDVRRQSAAGQGDTWHKMFEEFLGTHRALNQHLEAWGTQLMEDAKKTIPETMTLAGVDARSLDLARSFSFVGDPTPTVGEKA